MNVTYLLQVGDHGPVIVGTCTERGFTRRLNTIQSYNPEVLHIREYLDGDERLVHHLHVTLDQHHVRGDWYDAACLADVPAELVRLEYDREAEQRRIDMLEVDDLLRSGGGA